MSCLAQDQPCSSGNRPLSLCSVFAIDAPYCLALIKQLINGSPLPWCHFKEFNLLWAFSKLLFCSWVNTCGKIPHAYSSPRGIGNENGQCFYINNVTMRKGLQVVMILLLIHLLTHSLQHLYMVSVSTQHIVLLPSGQKNHLMQV